CVSKAPDETCGPGVVGAVAVGRLARGGGARRLPDPPGGPGPGEVDRASAAELEDAVRDRFEEPAVGGNQDDAGVERLQFLLEPLEARDVEAVGRLVEQQQIQVPSERARERGPRGLTS